MADDVSFTISASDQASKVVETVQKKIQNFGSDVAKLALGVVGPMALLQAGIGYVTDKWNEYKQAQTDAFENGAKGTYEEVKAQEALGEQLDKNLSVLLAMAKVKAENAKNAEDVKKQEDQAIQAFLQTEAGMKFKQQHTVQSTDESYYVATREQELAAARAEGERINAEIARKKAEELANLNGPVITPEQRAMLEEQNKITEEDKKRRSSGTYYNEQIGLFAKRFMDDLSSGPKQKTKDEVKNDLKLTVSSLREIGGSFGGGDVATGLERQIVIAEKQLDTLTEIKDALNRGSMESQVFPEGLRTAMETTA
jgi:hypothetical protein